jgi:hypothetical protein
MTRDNGPYGAFWPALQRDTAWTMMVLCELNYRFGRLPAPHPTQQTWPG